jgi:hypothetical protein
MNKPTDGLFAPCLGNDPCVLQKALSDAPARGLEAALAVLPKARPATSATPTPTVGFP